MKPIKIISGTSHPHLSQEIAKILKIKQTKISHIRFNNDNLFCRIEENIRDHDIFIIQTSTKPVNDYLMELYIMLDAAKYSSAGRITAVLPYFPYVRSDQKDQPRIPVTARLVADHLALAGADRILSIDFHSPQILGFFRIPADQLFASAVLLEYLKKSKQKFDVIVSPDAGGVKRARFYAQKLGASLAVMDKRRSKNDDQVHMGFIIGDVKGKKALIIDDEISTGGTIFNTAAALVKNGATSISAFCTHAILAGDAIHNLQKSHLENLIVTNSIPLKKTHPKIKVLSVAPLLAEVISRIHSGESLSSLFI
ncbi:MAG: ribose-phosphate pyrophosphokinase [Deltaproteobacteria bacterium]|nr:ribose-phosphate pyrophosphokinase [Deltaproteobacteria bacterium]